MLRNSLQNFLRCVRRSGKYEEACKVWQEECVKAEIEATKNRQYYEDVVRVSTNKSR